MPKETELLRGGGRSREEGRLDSKLAEISSRTTPRGRKEDGGGGLWLSCVTKVHLLSAPAAGRGNR